MQIQYEKFPFTKILGWSISRYEQFDKCKRQYFYNYYSSYVKDIPLYKIKSLKSLTSVPLEIGNIIHDVLEAFLRRLQKSVSDIDEIRFFNFARLKRKEYFSQKTFFETYYHQSEHLDENAIDDKITSCLNNFIHSPIYNWLFMKAITNRGNWMIEPEGYGETRLNGIKAYCKMDFLFPVDDHIYIIDWKTGKKDAFKHSNQLIGYAAAAHNNFHIAWKNIFPKIVYLYPQFDELEVNLSSAELENFFQNVSQQTEEMQALCIDKHNNIPLSIDHFPKTPSKIWCDFCNFQELCFPDRKNRRSKNIEF